MPGKISEQVLDEIRSRVDIVELIGSRVTLKKAGGSYKACCPFHHEKTPSFNVNQEKQFYHCFGCGESGDVFTFLMKQDGLTFMDAVRQLAEKVGVTLDAGEDDVRFKARNRLYALMGELAAFYRRCLLQTAEAAEARAYLAQRKLSDEVAESFGIGYAPRFPADAIVKWAAKRGFSQQEMVDAGVLVPSTRPDRSADFYDRFRGRLMFPICDHRGRVVAFSGRILQSGKSVSKYVNSPETEVFVKHRILYALHKASAKITHHPRREAIICEGQIDVIRCHASGFETAVASQGSAFSKDHVALLKKYADSVVLVFDGDAAGRKASLRTGKLFLEAEMPVRVARLPKEDDPDSLLREKGPEAFRAILDAAVSITAYQIETLRQNESSPDSIDAVSRISRAVMEMLAGCPGAVLRSHLLQEAADLLHLPFSALEADMARVLEEQRIRTARADAFKKTDSPVKPKGEAEPDPDADGPGSATEGEWEPADAADGEPLIDEAGVSRAPTAQEEAPRRPDPPSRNEYLLCELLMECERDQEVIALVRDYLPLDLLEHPFVRGFVAALTSAQPGDECALPAFFATVDSAWHPLVGQLIANEQKMLCANETTPADAAKDFIRAIWVTNAKKQRGALSAESTPENDAQRFRLSCLIKAFETEPWEKLVLRLKR